MGEVLLDIQGLKTQFPTKQGVVRAVDGVDLTVSRGETLGLVGEWLRQDRHRSFHYGFNRVARPDRAGSILFNGEDLLKNPGRHAKVAR